MSLGLGPRLGLGSGGAVVSSPTLSSVPGLLLLLDARLGTGTTTEGTAVATWSDQSGNSNDATQATSGKRGLYRANGMGTGLPAIELDNTDDGYSTPLVLSTVNYSIYAVYKPKKDGGNHRMVQADAGSNHLMGDYATDIQVYNGGFIDHGISSAIGYIHGYLSKSGSGRSRLTGVELSNGNGVAWGTVNIGDVGQAETADGYLSCLVVYDHELTAPEITIVEHYLSTTWGIGSL